MISMTLTACSKEIVYKDMKIDCYLYVHMTPEKGDVNDVDLAKEIVLNNNIHHDRCHKDDEEKGKDEEDE